jgi:hypothetical protein
MPFDVRNNIELLSDIKAISEEKRIIIDPWAWQISIGKDCRGKAQARGMGLFFAICKKGKHDICKNCK